MAKSKKKGEFPATLYVRMEAYNPPDPTLTPAAFVTERDAVDGDGPTQVAIYTLKEVVTLSKEVKRV